MFIFYYFLHWHTFQKCVYYFALDKLFVHKQVDECQASESVKYVKTIMLYAELLLVLDPSQVLRSFEYF